MSDEITPIDLREVADECTHDPVIRNHLRGAADIIEALRAELEAANTKHQQQLDLQWDAAKAVESERDDLSVRLSEHRELVAECNTALLRMQLERDEAREDAALSHKHYTETRAELAELRARVPAICFPRQPKCDIAEVIVDQVESWLSDSVPSDDFIIDVTEEQKDALNSIVWEWFYKNVSPKHWTVTDVHQHEAAILAAKEKGQ